MNNIVETTIDKKPIANRFLCGFFISALAFSVTAKDNTEIKVPLYLEDAIRMTLSHHPELAVFLHKTNMQKGAIQQAGIGEPAQIGLTFEDGLGVGEHSGLSNMQTTLTYSWLLQQEQINSRVGNAQTEMEQVDIDKHIVTMDLAASTAKQFTQILVKQERLKLNQMATLQANEVLKAISERVSAGRSSTIEMRMAEVEIVRMQLAVEDTEHDLKASQYQMSSLWGQPGTKFRVNGNLFALPVLSSLDKELDKLKKSPYITQFATATRIAQSQLELARIEAKSQWQFSAGLRRYEATDDFGLVAGVSVPFGASDRNAGTISTLQAKQDLLAVEQVALMQKLDSQLYVQLQEIAHARHVIDAFEKTIIPTLEVTLKEAVRAFELGQLSYSQWSDIRRDLLNAQSELLNTYESLHLQHIEIQRLTGASISL